MNPLKSIISMFRRSQFDEECRSVGRQAIEIAMQRGYGSFAFVSFRAINGNMVPIVEAPTPEQEWLFGLTR